MKTGVEIKSTCKGVSAPATIVKSQRGGTLVEVVMATCILSIMGAGIIGSVNYGIHTMRLARENARATQVMLEKLESVRLYNWEEVIVSGYVPARFVDVYDPQNSNSPGISYYGQMQVTPPVFGNGTPSYSTNMRQFTVTLNWTNNNGLAHQRSLTTYVSRDGMQNYVY